MDLYSGVGTVLFGAALVLIAVAAAYQGHLLRKQRRLDDEEAAADRADAGGEPDDLVDGVAVRRGWLAIGFGGLCVAGPGWALVDVVRDNRFPDLLWAIPFGVGVAAGLLIMLEGIEKAPRRGWSGTRVPRAG